MPPPLAAPGRGVPPNSGTGVAVTSPVGVPAGVAGSYDSPAPDSTCPSGTQLTPRSTGVTGLYDRTSRADGVLTSTGKDLRLDGGTQILLRVQTQ